MYRNKLLKSLTATMAFTALPCFGHAEKARPNIIYILIDDLGWMDLSCMGSDFYETPNIDRLRSQGMMFTNAYSACPVSSPSRASILTGKNPAHLQFTGHITAIGRHRYPEYGRIIPPQDRMYVSLEETMISEVLKSEGYRTVSIGKWHVGNEEKYFPEHQGFDINIAGYEHGSPPTYWAPYRNQDLEWNPRLKNLSEGVAGEYLTDRLTDEAIDYIHANKNVPFFMYLSHYAVHLPLEAPEEIVTKYRDKLEGKSGSMLNPVYGAMVEIVDRNVGRLLDELDSMGLTENTIVIFSSDNGGTTEATDNTPLREGKGFLYEGGIRIPLIFKWPGHIPVNSVCDEMVITDDMFPTIADMAGCGELVPNDIDGVSLSPLLEGNGSLERDMLCWYYPHYSPQAQMPGYAVRKGDYKLIEYYDPQTVELYNIGEDTGERNNLAESHPEKVEELREAFNVWLDRMHPVRHKLNPAYEENYRDRL